jgi:hypothetical protein
MKFGSLAAICYLMMKLIFKSLGQVIEVLNLLFQIEVHDPMERLPVNRWCLAIISCKGSTKRRNDL